MKGRSFIIAYSGNLHFGMQNNVLSRIDTNDDDEQLCKLCIYLHASDPLSLHVGFEMPIRSSELESIQRSPPHHKKGEIREEPAKLGQCENTIVKQLLQDDQSWKGQKARGKQHLASVIVEVQEQGGTK